MSDFGKFIIVFMVLVLLDVSISGAFFGALFVAWIFSE
jgi:hypothetical protein